MIELIVIVFGLLVGSFLTVVANRLGTPEPICFGRSRCPKCKKTLQAIDLIPVLSFIMFRGHCRQCKARISIEYPIVEIATALFALGIYLKFGLNFSSVILFVSVCALIVASLTDIKFLEVSSSVFIFGILTALLWYVVSGFSEQRILLLILAIFIGAIIPFLMYLISREKWMGLGDTFFAIWIAIISGYPEVVFAVFSAFLIGALFGIMLIATGKKQRRSPIPFGPFLALGGIIGLFAGTYIISLYLSAF